MIMDKEQIRKMLDSFTMQHEMIDLMRNQLAAMLASDIPIGEQRILDGLHGEELHEVTGYGFASDWDVDDGGHPHYTEQVNIETKRVYRSGETKQYSKMPDGWSLDANVWRSAKKADK